VGSESAAKTVEISSVIEGRDWPAPSTSIGDSEIVDALPSRWREFDFHSRWFVGEARPAIGERLSSSTSSTDEVTKRRRRH